MSAPAKRPPLRRSFARRVADRIGHAAAGLARFGDRLATPGKPKARSAGDGISVAVVAAGAIAVVTIWADSRIKGAEKIVERTPAFEGRAPDIATAFAWSRKPGGPLYVGTQSGIKARIGRDGMTYGRDEAKPPRGPILKLEPDMDDTVMAKGLELEDTIAASNGRPQRLYRVGADISSWPILATLTDGTVLTGDGFAPDAIGSQASEAQAPLQKQKQLQQRSTPPANRPVSHIRVAFADGGVSQVLDIQGTAVWVVNPLLPSDPKKPVALSDTIKKPVALGGTAEGQLFAIAKETTGNSSRDSAAIPRFTVMDQTRSEDSKVKGEPAAFVALGGRPGVALAGRSGIIKLISGELPWPIDIVGPNATWVEERVFVGDDPARQRAAIGGGEVTGSIAVSTSAQKVEGPLQVNGACRPDYFHNEIAADTRVVFDNTALASPSGGTARRLVFVETISTGAKRVIGGDVPPVTTVAVDVPNGRIATTAEPEQAVLVYDRAIA